MLYVCAARRDTRTLVCTSLSSPMSLLAQKRLRQKPLHRKTLSNFLWMRGPQRHAHDGLHKPIIADLNPTPKTLAPSYACAVRRDTRTVDCTSLSLQKPLLLRNYGTAAAESTTRNFLWMRGPQRPAHAGLHQPILAHLTTTPKTLKTSYERAVRRDRRTLD